MSKIKLDQRGVLIPCPSCGRTNRVPYSALGKTTRCAHCHTALPATGEPLEVPDAAIFDALIASSSLPVVVDFWAPWCGPCKAIGPVLEEIAKEYNGRLKVVKMNVDENPQTPSKFGVRGIPNLILFKAGEVREQIVGAVPKSQLVKAINQVV